MGLCAVGYAPGCYFRHLQAGVAQLVEHQLPKLRVAGSSPVSRSYFRYVLHLYCLVKHTKPYYFEI